MVMKTNRLANNLLSKSTVKDKSKLKRWVHTTTTEMKAFFGLIFLIDLVKKSRLTEYWSIGAITAIPFFNQITPRDRFKLLLCCRHFCNDDFAPDDDGTLQTENHLQNFEKEQKALAKKRCFVKVEKSATNCRMKARIIVLRWKDKRDVMMLTTCHFAKIITVKRKRRQREKKKKSKSVVSNNNICMEWIEWIN